MNKLLLKVNKPNDLTYSVDGYVLGMKDFSYLYGKTYDVSEIKNIKDNNNDKEIFVSFNKMIFNDELEAYKKALIEVDELGVNGIIVGDIAALTYGLKTNIILDQMHLNNSYYTINHYYNNDVDGILLNNDITLKEIDEIRHNTKSILFKQAFGYPHLSTSKRMLVTNYLKHFNIDKKSKSYEIKENNSDDYYKILQDDYGTHILGCNPINLLGVNLNVDYVILDGFLLDEIEDVITAFKNNQIEKKEEINKKYNANCGFINKETMYKVKKDER